MKKIFMIVCAFFFKRIASLNRRYDNQSERKRFLTSTWFGLGPIITLNLLAVITTNTWYSISTMIWVLLITCIRFWWFHKDLRSWLPEDKSIDITRTT